jgi:colanic acid biosynthesis glycosyl transferase WcaI
LRIIIYGINYAPELTGIGKYTGEMATWLANRGHTIHVITGKPYYPEWKIYESYSGKLWQKEIVNGVLVTRCPLYVPQKITAVKRIIHEFSFLAGVFPVWLRSLFQTKYDLVIGISPPFHLGFLPLLYAKIRGVNLLIHVQDLQVDAAKNLQLIRNKWLLNLMFAGEKAILKNSTAVSTISPGMMDRIRNKNIPVEKTILFPNWVDTDFIRPLGTEESLRKEFGLSNDDKVILYSGNLGEKQGLEMIVEAAKYFISRKNIHFIVVGSGAFRKNLEEIVKKNNLDNIRLFPLAPYEKLPALLAIADIHLVLQKRSAADLVMPSKLSGILAAGGCAIITTTPGTYLHDLIEKNKIGILIEPECIQSLIAALDNALTNELREVRENARNYAVKNLSKQHILMKFENDLFGINSISGLAVAQKL